jgi:phosphate transport system permease protein
MMMEPNKNEEAYNDLTRPSDQLRRRYRTGKVWQGLFFASTAIGIIALLALLITIINQSFGYVAVENKVDPATLSDRPLEELSHDELAGLLVSHLPQNRINTLERDKPFVDRSTAEMYNLVVDRVVEPKVVKSWTLLESVLDRSDIFAMAQEEYPEAEIQFYSWFNPRFLVNSMSPKPELAGVRTALLGSLWIILITILVAFPVGVGAAIYLEEYAKANRINRIIQTNIDNLAGVPSIVYGILGLAIFVRSLHGLTSGEAFGSDNDSGRTILSAGLTLTLLILPILIINAQEAIRAVPNSLRQASYGLGATRWQTIWHHVIPSALPGILTGTILAISRAIGETAPLIVVGASTYITTDPSGPFSQFTALPIQIYNWTTRPQDTFRNIAAAAILVLLISLLTMNAAAILLRNRFSRRTT